MLSKSLIQFSIDGLGCVPSLLFGLRSNYGMVKERKVKSFSPVQLFMTPWTVAYQAPLSMEFSRQEYWSGLPFPSPDDLPDPGIEPRYHTLQANALPSKPPGKQNTGKSVYYHISDNSREQ